MYQGIYNICKSKIYYYNSTWKEKGKMEEYCHKMVEYESWKCILQTLSNHKKLKQRVIANKQIKKINGILKNTFNSKESKIENKK